MVISGWSYVIYKTLHHDNIINYIIIIVCTCMQITKTSLISFKALKINLNSILNAE